MKNTQKTTAHHFFFFPWAEEKERAATFLDEKPRSTKPARRTAMRGGTWSGVWGFFGGLTPLSMHFGLRHEFLFALPAGVAG